MFLFRPQSIQRLFQNKKRMTFLTMAGITTTMTVGFSNVALAQENLNQTQGPMFSLDKPYYDESTYWGRVKNIWRMINPLTLLISDDDLKQSQKLLEQYKEGTIPSNVNDADLWNARKIVESTIHGPTGEKMFLPGRMSAFVLVNVPICIGMLIHGPTSTAAQVFWQWVNQSYNVMNNYVNRAGPEVEYKPLLMSYGLATTASISIALGCGALLARYPGLKKFGRAIPYFAVATAGTLNVSFTRMDEIRNGIKVMDKEGNNLGVSIAAGRLAVWKTVTTRSMFLPIIVLGIPPIGLGLLSSTNIIVLGTASAITAEVLLICLSMGTALPCALALLPQTMSLDCSSLEPKFHDLKDKNGNAITHVYASKGL